MTHNEVLWLERKKHPRSMRQQLACTSPAVPQRAEAAWTAVINLVYSLINVSRSTVSRRRAASKRPAQASDDRARADAQHYQNDIT